MSLFVFNCYDKHHHQKQFRENRVSFASSFCFALFLSLSTWVTFYHWGKSEQKPKAGTWRKELKQKLCATYWIAQHSLLYKPWHLFNYNVLGLPTSIINQENIPRLAYRPILCSISDFRFPLSRWPILCQVNKIDN